MLNQEELVDLYRTHRETPVLSVYLDGKAGDFADRKTWRRRFDQEVTQARKLARAETDEADAGLEKALAHISAELDAFDNFLPDRGWVGFATPDGVVQSGSVRVPMPDLVRWEKGIRVAPYVRALKQERLVLTVLVDSRRARIFEYRGGELGEPENLNAETFLGDLTDVNVSKRPTNHSGVRGKTGTDAAQNYLGVGSRKMMKKLGQQVHDRLGTDGHLVIGGTPEAVTQALEQVPGQLNGRMIRRTALRVEMTDAEVISELEAAASELNQSLQLGLLEDVVDQARSGGRGALGADPVEKALREARVDTLLLSRNFMAASPDYADHLVGAAFEQHAEVEELSTEGAARLDSEGEGVAARLRYTL